MQNTTQSSQPVQPDPSLMGNQAAAAAPNTPPPTPAKTKKPGSITQTIAVLALAGVFIVAAAMLYQFQQTQSLLDNLNERVMQLEEKPVVMPADPPLLLREDAMPKETPAMEAEGMMKMEDEDAMMMGTTDAVMEHDTAN